MAQVKFELCARIGQSSTRHVSLCASQHTEHQHKFSLTYISCFTVVLFSEPRPVAHVSINPLRRSTAGWSVCGIPLLHTSRRQFPSLASLPCSCQFSTRCSFFTPSSCRVCSSVILFSTTLESMPLTFSLMIRNKTVHRASLMATSCHPGCDAGMSLKDRWLSLMFVVSLTVLHNVSTSPAGNWKASHNATSFVYAVS